MGEISTLHIGKKIERIRTLRGIKQEALAASLGITQAAISKMEQSQKISEEKLEEIAKALGVTADAIKNFNEDAAVNIIANTVNNHDQAASVFYNPTFNPIDKLVQLFEENKQLYERLLKSEREKVDWLEAQLKKK
jgi:transcriptional regulator with XRE-family HTH domain